MIFKRPLSAAALIGTLLAAASVPSAAFEALEQIDPNPGGKSVQMAYGSLLLGTVVPIGLGSMMVSQSEDARVAPWLIFGGVFLGPSMGQFYANSVGTGLLASAIRFGGAAMFLSGALSGLGEGGGNGSGTSLMLTGSLVFIGGTFYSLIDTHLAVDRYQQRFRSRAIGITPTLELTRGGDLQPGAMAYIMF